MERGQEEPSLRERVREQFLELIGHMDFGYSTRLLSENQLATKFQVSCSTIRAVLSELELVGKVICRRGSGTYVNPTALHVETRLYPQPEDFVLPRYAGGGAGHQTEFVLL